MSRGCGGLVNCSYVASPDPVLSYMASPDPVLAKASLDPPSAKAFSKPANSKYSDSAITNYLKSGVYPDGVDKVYKSGLRKRSKFFVLGGGHLHYVGGKDKRTPRLVVQSEQEQHRLVKVTHDAAHLGRDKVLSQLNEKYYWPAMYSQVCEYVSIFKFLYSSLL